MRKSSVCTEDFLLISRRWNKSEELSGRQTFPTLVRLRFLSTTGVSPPRTNTRAGLLIYFPSTGLLCDLLWSDPDKDTQGWGENDRGVSFTFGADVVTAFLKRQDLDLICRAHQVGFSFPL